MVVYALMFTFAFSACNNFGVLSQWRTQLFPIVAAVLTVPYRPALKTRSDRSGDVSVGGAGPQARR